MDRLVAHISRQPLDAVLHTESAGRRKSAACFEAKKLMPTEPVSIRSRRGPEDERWIMPPTGNLTRDRSVFLIDQMIEV